jgi:hypothetical protein
MTIVSQLIEAQTAVTQAKEELGGGTPAAAREFALANTAIEDAIMRVNRGFAFKHDHFAVADVEASD